MSSIKPENFMVIQGWMITELNLKGNELLIYAIIYGFSQEENTWFNGSRQYLADWTNSTKNGVSKCLQKLVENKLLLKKDEIINNVKFCKYKTAYITRGEESQQVGNKVVLGGQQSCSGVGNKVVQGGQLSCSGVGNKVVQGGQLSCSGVGNKVVQGGQLSCPNNIEDNINNNIINNISSSSISPSPLKTETKKQEEEDFPKPKSERVKIRESVKRCLAEYPNQMGGIKMSVYDIFMSNKLYEKESEIIAGIKAWKESDQWKNDGGRFIPTFSNFIEREVWACKPPKTEQVEGREIKSYEEEKAERERKLTNQWTEEERKQLEAENKRMHAEIEEAMNWNKK